MLALLLLLGCGGDGGGGSSRSSATTTSVGKGKGRALLRIKWPARTNARLIPNAANSISVALLQGGAVVASKTIPRPADGSTSTSTTLTGLAYGIYTVWAQAYPNADGNGVAQAYGGGTMTVTEDAPGSLGVALDSSVVALAIVPAAPVVSPGGTTPLVASAKDAGGDVVLLAAGGGTESLAWTSDDPAVATVSGTGPAATLSGVALGTAHVTATLRIDDAGDVVSTYPTAVSVVDTPVTVSPAATKVTYNLFRGFYYPSPSSVLFRATLGASLAGSTVVWSVRNSSTVHGTIGQSGIYNSPAGGNIPPEVGDTIVATVTKDGVSYTGTASVVSP